MVGWKTSRNFQALLDSETLEIIHFCTRFGGVALDLLTRSGISLKLDPSPVDILYSWWFQYICYLFILIVFGKWSKNWRAFFWMSRSTTTWYCLEMKSNVWTTAFSNSWIQNSLSTSTILTDVSWASTVIVWRFSTWVPAKNWQKVGYLKKFRFRNHYA